MASTGIISSELSIKHLAKLPLNYFKPICIFCELCYFHTELPAVFLYLLRIISINIGNSDKPIIARITVSKLFFTKSRFPKSNQEKLS
jgi:hypothetical protein